MPSIRKNLNITYKGNSYNYVPLEDITVLELSELVILVYAVSGLHYEDFDDIVERISHGLIRHFEDLGTARAKGK